MNHNSLCPHCGKIVEPGDTVCSNCWCDLRSVAAPAPHSPSRPDAAFAPDTKLERQPLYSQTMQEPVSAQPPYQAPPNPPAAPSPVSTPAGRDRGQRPPAADWDNAGFGDTPSVRFTEPPPKRTGTPAPAGDQAMPFRPRLRPPMAVLRVFDDDLRDGETIRIRGPEFSIGRSEGDLQFPLERMMSARHAKISCRYERDHYRWYLTDLGSSNGTFLRIKSGKFEHSSEILIGSHRYRFNANPQGRAAAAPPEAPPPASATPPAQTMAWKTVSPERMLEGAASLIRILPDGKTTEFQILSADAVIGSDPGRATVRIMDDPMLSGAHIRIYQDDHRRWMLEDLDSQNGVWLSVREKHLDMSTQFQLGEQRFGIRFP